MPLPLRFLVLLLVAISPAAWAQCPDGSPPPCAPRVRPDSNVVLVLPLKVSGPPGTQYLGEATADLLRMALDGVAGIRVHDAPTTLRRLHALPVPGDARAATALARESGAGRVIGGSVVAVGGLRLRVEMFDAIRGRRQFDIERQGGIDQVVAMVDSVASTILARRLVPKSRRILASEVATRSPAALHAYLVARQLNLHGQRKAAADSLKVALRHDPTFGAALALLVRVDGAFIGVAGLSAEQWADVHRTLRENRHRYDDRLRAEIDLIEANQLGERVRYLALAREVATRYPLDATAARVHADAHFHHGLNLGESRERVIALIRQALAFDDQDGELLDHLVVLHQEDGDTAAAREVTERCQAMNLCSMGAGSFFLQRAIGANPRLLAGLDDTLLLPTFYILRGGAANIVATLRLWDSLAARQTLPGRSEDRRSNAYLVRSIVALARRQHQASDAFLDSARLWRPERLFRAQLLHDILIRQREPVADGMVPQRDRSARVTLLWRTAMQAPGDSADVMLRELERWPYPDSLAGVALAAGLRGIVALRRGDTSAARQLLIASRSNSKLRGFFDPPSVPNLWLSLKLAELEVARGDHLAARLYLSDLYPVHHYAPFIGDVEALRARIALALGDTATARASLRIVADLWDGADPAVQPRVAQARAMLARLEGQ